MATPYELSADGIELQACNGTGHFGLTIPLLPMLKKTDGMPGAQVRIVNLSSIAHRSASSHPDFSSLEALNRTYSNTWIRYGNSKLSVRPSRFCLLKSLQISLSLSLSPSEHPLQ